MALLPLRVFAYSPCGEFYVTKRLAQLDLLSARIPQMGVEVNGAFNKLKKTRGMFLVGAPRFELGTSCAQGRRATRLRYAPTVTALFILKHLPTLFLILTIEWVIAP
jgi:hypothetical protein